MEKKGKREERQGREGGRLEMFVNRKDGKSVPWYQKATAWGWGGGREKWPPGEGFAGKREGEIINNTPRKKGEGFSFRQTSGDILWPKNRGERGATWVVYDFRRGEKRNIDCNRQYLGGEPVRT